MVHLFEVYLRLRMLAKDRASPEKTDIGDDVILIWAQMI